MITVPTGGHEGFVAAAGYVSSNIKTTGHTVTAPACEVLSFAPGFDLLQMGTSREAGSSDVHAPPEL